jgi:hypothetical protein
MHVPPILWLVALGGVCLLENSFHVSVQGLYPAPSTKVSSNSRLSMIIVCSCSGILNHLFLALLSNATFDIIVSDLAEKQRAVLMPKKSKSTATAVATPAGNGQSNPGVSNTPPLLTAT